MNELETVRAALRAARDDKAGEHRVLTRLLCEHLLDTLEDFENQYDPATDSPAALAAGELDALREVELFLRGKLHSTVAVSATVYVDIPTVECIGNPEGAWRNVLVAPNREAAVAWVREHLGWCDDAGNICLLSGGDKVAPTQE
jgi:hypothetical protein